MAIQTAEANSALFVNEIPRWGEPYPNILNRQSVLECLTDYILQVNHNGYHPDPRKVLAVRTSDRTATLRNAAPPLRQEVYYFIEGEIFPATGVTRLQDGKTPAELAEELLEQMYEQLYIWTAYDFTKGSPPGFRKPFDTPWIHLGSQHPNPERKTRGKNISAGVNTTPTYSPLSISIFPPEASISDVSRQEEMAYL